MSSFVVVVTGSWRGPPPPPCRVPQLTCIWMSSRSKWVGEPDYLPHVIVSNFGSHTKQKIPLPVWHHLIIYILPFFQSTNQTVIWAWRVPPLFTDKVLDKKEKCKNTFWIVATCDCPQGGRTWQPFVGGKNGNENFRQARIYNFRDKCVMSIILWEGALWR